ncbi:MAG: hypothetical protein Q9M92_08455 [Enterobacterales bacterium]|nr:hypothetical protein [Enterobacterales bacterium]
MKAAFVFLMVFVVYGCTSLRPIELSPLDLQAKIVEENIIQIGDEVKLVTSNGIHHEFTIESISSSVIKGKNTEVLVKDIVAIETREFSGGKTSLLVGGSFLTLWIFIAAIPAVVVL